MKLWGITSVDFGVTDQRLIRVSISSRYWGKIGVQCRVHQLFIDFKKAWNSVRREVLYDIITECGIPRKLAGLIKVCLNETYSTVRIDRKFSVNLPVQNGLKHGDSFSSLLFNSASEYAIGGVQVNQEGLKLNGTHHDKPFVLCTNCSVGNGKLKTI
jgi:hypothetical protein